MKAWIENGRVRDIAQGNPQDNYHPDVAKLYDTEVPDGTVSGATLVAGVWTNPPPPPIPTAAEIAAALEAELARQAAADKANYASLRAAAYPPLTDYLDGIVKGDTVQVQAYIDACLAVKAKFPK